MGGPWDVPSIEILGTWTIDERDSAFPQAVQMPNGDVLCSYSNSGGQSATGGTDWARSMDGGRTWRVEGTLLPATREPATTNFLKLSLSPDGRTIYAYGSLNSAPTSGAEFGQEPVRAIFCTSTDGGHKWSKPATIPMPSAFLEISHGILPLASGRLLAPAATVASGRLGEQVVVVVSEDGGATWPRRAIAMQDPAGKLGYFEQKLAEIGPNRVVCSGWTVTLDDVADRPNSYTVSEDGGLTWSAPRSIGTHGQTISVVPLGGNHVLLLYNRRYGDQGIVAAIAEMTDHEWPIAFERPIYDPGSRREGRLREGGVAEMTDFAFGFPTAVRLANGTFLVIYWSVERGICGVRCASLKVNR
jgi:BNR repeat protein